LLSLSLSLSISLDLSRHLSCSLSLSLSLSRDISRGLSISTLKDGKNTFAIQEYTHSNFLTNRKSTRTSPARWRIQPVDGVLRFILSILLMCMCPACESGNGHEQETSKHVAVSAPMLSGASTQVVWRGRATRHGFCGYVLTREGRRV